MNNTSHLVDTQTYLHLCVSLPVWIYLYFTPLLPGTSLPGSVFFLCVAPLSSLPPFSPPQSAFFVFHLPQRPRPASEQGGAAIRKEKGRYETRECALWIFRRHGTLSRTNLTSNNRIFIAVHPLFMSAFVRGTKQTQFSKKSKAIKVFLAQTKLII